MFLPEDDIVKVCVLASGSSGNCTLIATGRTRLLVDAGLSRKEICRRLVEDAGEDPSRLDAIIISHEHSDHVAGLPVLARHLADLARRAGRTAPPILLTTKTAPGIAWNSAEPAVETFPAGTSLTIGDIDIQTFTIPHDSIDPIGFCFRAAGVRIGLVTDLGYIPDSVKFHLLGTHLLILEANHDLEMLKVGPYPWAVKQRVMGRHGHLSNEVAAGFLRHDLDPSTDCVVLGHLSENNNHPALAELAATQAIRERGLSTRIVVMPHGSAAQPFHY